MGNSKINISTDNLISQVETVRFDLNMNPLGAPESVHRAILNNINVLTEYPDRSYKRLRESISEYCHTNSDNILIGNSSYEFIKLFIEFNTPKKVLLLTPGAHYYEQMLKMNGCDLTYYSIPEEDDFELDIADFISSLSDEIDMVFISNPNAVTSKVIDRESMEFIAKVCKGNDIFLVVDEKYIEFVKDYDECTSIPLTEEYDNLVVLRNTTKFFSIPGLRLTYAVTSNVVLRKTLEIAGFPYSINKLVETAGVDMFKDASYIKDTETLINTERNLVFSALSSRKTIKLYKPDANYILIKLLKKDITAQDVVEHCINRGLYIRSCSDITGLNNKYIRFCFMNPKQNDLLVNTILEIV